MNLLIVACVLCLLAALMVLRAQRHRAAVRVSKLANRLGLAKREVEKLKIANERLTHLNAISMHEIVRLGKRTEELYFGGVQGKLIAALGKELDEARKEIQRLRATPLPESRPQR